MVDSMVSTALEKIRNLLTEEAVFLSGVSDGVEQVQSELRLMHCFLKEADKRQDTSPLVRNMVAEIKDLAYRAEDVLEKYTIEVSSNRSRNITVNFLKRLAHIWSDAISLHQVGKEIEAIKSHLTILGTRLPTYNVFSVGEGSETSNTEGEHLTYSHQIEEHFVGMEKDLKALVKLLLVGDEKPHRLISICGMGGLGKTTLARKVYQHYHVRQCFKSRAWVCISQRLQVKIVLQRILKQLLPSERKEEVVNMDQNEMVEELHNVQVREKCLVVIDDIWEVEHWNILKPAFPVEGGGSKVLLTTRNNKIVEERCVYKLNCLGEDHGLELLQKIALPKNGEQELGGTEFALLENIAREIIRRCGYLPLAISVIGGVLREKKTLCEWENVSRNIDSYLMHGEGTIDRDKRVGQVLDLSYNVLPYHLKPCFLYMGCFFEDEEIEAEKLYLLWIAEGMISCEEKGRENTLRDVAERYLSELASRCMVQVQMEEFSTYRRFKSCRLRDLMRDLCLSKGEEEGFLKVIDFRNQTYPIPSVGRTRRVAIHFDAAFDHNLNLKKKLENLRSLLLVNEWRDETAGIGFGHFISKLDRISSFLRILLLEIRGLKSQKLPSRIDKLVHLRYLGIRGCHMEEVPSLCNLALLQTLYLQPLGSCKLSNVIYKMRSLRHLFLKFRRRGHDANKLRLDGLNELETLEGFDSRYDRAEDLPKLTNLQCLSADVYDIESLAVIVHHIVDNNQTRLRETNLRMVSCDFDTEEGSTLLRKIFMCRTVCSLWIDGRISYSLPSYGPELGRGLVELSLVLSTIEDDPMEMLENLPMLRALGLCDGAFVGKEMVCRATGFRRLKYLLLASLPNLEKWRVEDGALRNLSRLRIGECKKLEMIPDGLRSVTSLEKLEVFSMPKDFNRRLQVVDGGGGEDYDKVRHIPTISFED